MVKSMLVRIFYPGFWLTAVLPSNQNPGLEITKKKLRSMLIIKEFMTQLLIG